MCGRHVEKRLTIYGIMEHTCSILFACSFNMLGIISIKGSREGLRLQLSEGAAWDEVLMALREQLERGAQFFNGAKIAVDIGERALSNDELSTILELMQQHGLEAEALISSARESSSAARAAGIVTRPVLRAAEREETGDTTSFIQRTLRSGQVVRHHGHLLIVGDVNPGAEVIAAGSVVVWGRVRGIVHAGALGDRSAIICALELAPTQLRIADLITRSPDSLSGKAPETARVVNDQISVDAWDGYRKP